MTLLLLAGCSSARYWQKPDAGPEELATDIATCERQADRQAEEEAFSGRGGPNTAIIDVDRARGITRETQGTLRRGANLTEKARRTELFRQCMFAKGYRLEAR